MAQYPIQAILAALMEKNKQDKLNRQTQVDNVAGALNTVATGYYNKQQNELTEKKDYGKALFDLFGKRAISFQKPEDVPLGNGTIPTGPLDLPNQGVTMPGKMQDYNPSMNELMEIRRGNMPQGVVPKQIANSGEFLRYNPETGEAEFTGIPRGIPGNAFMPGQKSQTDMEAEARRGRQQKLNMLRDWGGTYKASEFEQLASDGFNFNPDAYIKLGGGTKTTDPDTGESVYRLIPRKEWERRIGQKNFKVNELADFKNYTEENTRWQKVLDDLDRAGIGESNLAELGNIEFEMLKTPLGTFSVPARFNLTGQYLQKPEYTAIKRNIETAFQAFRKRVTGAQAGEKELSYLRDVMPQLVDRPEIFFQTIHTIMDTNNQTINELLDMYNSVGRDTEGIRGYFNDGGDYGGGAPAPAPGASGGKRFKIKSVR